MRYIGLIELCRSSTPTTKVRISERMNAILCGVGETITVIHQREDRIVQATVDSVTKSGNRVTLVCTAADGDYDAFVA